MKQTKTKVLLTLLVAVAMMLFAVPAFAAEKLYVSTQPVSVTAYEGTTASFTVAATGGSGSYVWQWQSTKTPDNAESWSPISDNNSAKTAKLNVAALTATSGTYYRCVVTDTTTPTPQEAVSNADTDAKLTVLAKPTVTVKQNGTTNTTAVTVDEGKTATFVAAATNNATGYTPDYTYQWQVSTDNGVKYTDISGATSETYTTDKATVGMDGYKYNCVVTDKNAVSGSYSAATPITLNVNSVVSIKTQPSDVAVQQMVTKAVDAKFVAEYQGGKDPYTIAWKVSTNGGKTWDDVAATSYEQVGKKSTLTVDVPRATSTSINMNGYQYKFVVKSDGTTVESNVATLTVKDALKVVTDPTGATAVNVAKGSGTTLTATVTGGASPYVIAWYKVGSQSAVGTGATLTLTSDQVVAANSTDNGYYCTVIDSNADSVSSANVIFFALTDGSISDGIIAGTAGTKLATEPSFTITLPEGYSFNQNININDTISSWITNIDDLTATVTAREGNKLTFKVTGTPTNSSIEKIKVSIPATWSAAAFSTILKSDGTSYNQVMNITENTNAKFQITEPATAKMIEVKNVDAKAPYYNGTAQAAELGAKDTYKDKIGAISNLRYYTDMFDLTSTAPTDAGIYSVVADIAASEQYTANPNQKLERNSKTERGAGYQIKQATQEVVAAAPTTYFTWTATKEYTGKALSADVAFASGITKAGTIKTVTYKLLDAKGVETEASTTSPVEIGTYNVYVTTKDGGSNVAAVSDVKVGTFEITKLQPKAAMFTQTPTTAEFTGNPIAVAVAPTKDYEGKVGAVTVKYFTADGKTQLAGAPTAAGKYVIKVDVAASDTYAAATDLEVGTLTINATTAPSITYAAHVQNIGDQKAVSDWGIAGTEGQALRMEAITISVPTTANVQLKAQAHVQNIGWDANEIKTGSTVTVGTKGQSLRMEALRLQLTGTDAAKYQIKVKAHIQNYGWTDDKVIKSTDDFNNTTIGTTGESLRMEAIKIIIEPVSK